MKRKLDRLERGTLLNYIEVIKYSLDTLKSNIINNDIQDIEYIRQVLQSHSQAAQTLKAILNDEI